MKSVLNVEVSCTPNFFTPANPRSVNLLTWLNSSKYAREVESIRANSHKKERDKLKAILPAITPSGLFSYVDNDHLLQHSGLICLDIDAKGNERIGNYMELKQQLCRIPNVAYCGLSVSGTGFFLLIPIAYPEKHGEQFNALRELFQHRFKVRIDNTPDVKRLRGYSYDPKGYFNHEARPFGGVYKPQAGSPAVTPKRSYQVSNQFFESIVLSRCSRLIEEAVDGEKHSQLVKASILAGGYIAGGVLDEQTAINVLEDVISQKPNVADFKAAQRTIQAGIRNGKTRPLYDERPNLSEQVSPNSSIKTSSLYLEHPSEQKHHSPKTHIETYTRDGHTWQVVINDRGYPLSWD